MIYLQYIFKGDNVSFGIWEVDDNLTWERAIMDFNSSVNKCIIYKGNIIGGYFIKDLHKWAVEDYADVITINVLTPEEVEELIFILKI